MAPCSSAFYTWLSRPGFRRARGMEMKNQRWGFTLIELLVVIAIIAILAAILFPVFAQAKRAAKSAASLSNVKQIGTAAMMYSTDSDDLNTPVEMPSGPWLGWGMIMQPYMKNAN